MSKGKRTVEVSEKEENLILLIRNLKYGELRIIVQDSEPTRAESIKESIRL